MHASADTGHLGRAVWPFGRVAAVQVNQWLRWDHPPPSLGVKDSHKWCEDHFGATGTQVRADVSPPPPPIQSKRSTVLHYQTMQPSPLRTTSKGQRPTRRNDDHSLFLGDARFVTSCRGASTAKAGTPVPTSMSFTNSSALPTSGRSSDLTPQSVAPLLLPGT